MKPFRMQHSWQATRHQTAQTLHYPDPPRQRRANAGPQVSGINKNVYRQVNEGIGRTPHEATFGCRVHLGLQDTKLPASVRRVLQTEEQLRQALGVDTGGRVDDPAQPPVSPSIAAAAAEQATVRSMRRWLGARPTLLRLRKRRPRPAALLFRWRRRTAVRAVLQVGDGSTGAAVGAELPAASSPKDASEGQPSHRGAAGRHQRQSRNTWCWPRKKSTAKHHWSCDGGEHTIDLGCNLFLCVSRLTFRNSLLVVAQSRRSCLLDSSNNGDSHDFRHVIYSEVSFKHLRTLSVRWVAAANLDRQFPSLCVSEHRRGIRDRHGAWPAQRPLQRQQADLVSGRLPHCRRCAWWRAALCPRGGPHCVWRERSGSF